MTRHSSTLFHAACCPSENFLMPVRTGWESAKIVETGLGGLEVLKNAEDAHLVQTVLPQQVSQMLCDTRAAPELLTKKWWKCFSAKPDYCLTDICKEDRRDFIKNKQTNKQISVWSYIISLPDPKFFCFTAMGFLPFPWMMTESFTLQRALWIKWLPLN